MEILTPKRKLNKLQAFLKERRIPQKELAKKVGVSNATVSRWISEGTMPISVARIFARFLGLSQTEAGALLIYNSEPEYEVAM